MENFVAQIFKTFNHIVREIQIYFLGGLIFILNIYTIDYFYYNSSLYTLVFKENLPVVFIAIVYISGHFCCGIFYTFSKFLKCVFSFFNFNIDYSVSIPTEKEPKIYLQHRDAYLHFIERYAILSMMRWSFCSAFFSTLIILVSFLFKYFYWQILLLTIVNFVGMISMFFLYKKTDKEYASRIDSMENNESN